MCVRGVLLVTAVLALSGATTRVALAENDEYRVKAAFIRSFPRFVERPGGGSGPWALCLLGDDPFGSAFESAGSDGVAVTKRRIANPAQAADCQMLFISRSEQGNVKAIVGALPGAVLTLGDTEGFAANGVMVNFFLEAAKVRFEINLGAAKRAGVSISSKVLSLARIVKDQ